tara:strand:+ start:175 stop:645 length:471 start_codon:yes stop_codon:yes gene_type:complete
MAESEKDPAIRMERILLAALKKEEYPTQLLKQNMDNIGEFDFSYPEKVEVRKLAVALKSKDASQVKVKVSHFQGRVYSVDIPGEDRKIWITKAVLNLRDANTDYDCLPLTDWKVALPIQEAQFKSKEIVLVVKPMEIIFHDNEDSRKLFLVLGVVD